MNSMLITALVAPRQDDLRKSARAAMAGVRVRCSSAPLPLPAWTRSLEATGPAKLAAEPVATGACGDAA
jgi:hypothetical protein